MSSASQNEKAEEEKRSASFFLLPCTDNGAMIALCLSTGSEGERFLGITRPSTSLTS